MRWLWLMAGLAVSVALAAPPAFDPERLRSLVQAGRMAAAYDYARNHRAEHEGEARFDFYYGRAAIDTGHLSEGVFALERVLMVQPGNDRARLELARGYFLLREDQRAREAFTTVLAHDPPPSVAATVAQFLRAIRQRADRYRTTISGHATAGLGYDTNTNSGPGPEEPILGPLTAKQFGLEGREDGFANAGAAVRVSHPLTPAWGLYGEADARYRAHFSEQDFDQAGFGVSKGVRHRGARHRSRLGLRARRLEVGGSHYQTQGGLEAGLDYAVTPLAQASAFAQALGLRYPDSETRDATLWTAGGGGSYRFLGGWYVPAVSGSLYGGQELAARDSQAAEAIAERDFYGTQLGLRFFVHPEITVRLRAGYRRSDYGAEQALFGKTRADDQYTAALSGDWQLRPDLRWRVELDGRRNRSNTALHDYDRIQVRSGVRYDFH